MPSLRLRVPNAVGAITRCGADDVTDLAVMDPLDRFAVIQLTSILRARDDRCPIRLCFGVCPQAGFEAGGIHASRFFGEHMLARVDRFGDVLRSKTRWRGKQHDVDIGIVQDSLVAVQIPTVQLVVVDRNLVFVAFQPAPQFARFLRIQIRDRIPV